MNNFINEMVGIKSANETPTSRTSLSSVNATSSKVKFGKLTLNRGPSKEDLEEKLTLQVETNKPHNSRNIPSMNDNQINKGNHLVF